MKQLNASNVSYVTKIYLEQIVITTMDRKNIKDKLDISGENITERRRLYRDPPKPRSITIYGWARNPDNSRIEVTCFAHDPPYTFNKYYRIDFGYFKCPKCLREYGSYSCKLCGEFYRFRSGADRHISSVNHFTEMLEHNINVKMWFDKAFVQLPTDIINHILIFTYRDDNARSIEPAWTE